MTAMAGWVVAQARPLDKGVLERMCATLKRYGPDAQQVVQREGAAMLRTLLRITPEDRWDQQPCLSADGQWLSVFVGRLDNREELAQALAVPAGQLIDMADAEAAELLASMGQSESGLDQLARIGFAALGLQTYLTAGPKEARAWTIHTGWTAPQAAGVIHTDFERGFIRAQTIAFDDFIQYKGEAGAKDAGKMRAEGKEYIVKDGDVLNFLFNV